MIHVFAFISTKYRICSMLWICIFNLSISFLILQNKCSFYDKYIDKA